MVSSGTDTHLNLANVIGRLVYDILRNVASLRKEVSFLDVISCIDLRPKPTMKTGNAESKRKNAKSLDSVAMESNNCEVFSLSMYLSSLDFLL